jgi:predicted dehydrogenase/nucleoside-diphosphate-sugar epimerase
MPIATEESMSPAANKAPARIDPASPTRVAVVGAGYIADYHFDVLRDTPGVELVAVCDLDRGRAAEAAKARGAAHAVTDPSELVGLGIQVAHVLTPPDRHFSVARDLLESGVGVFAEKPVALTTAEARELADLAAERGLPFGVNHNAAFHPGFQRLLADVRAGRIGRVEHVQATLSVPLRQLDANDFTHWMFRIPRNIVFEQAPHPFSQLVELVGGVREMDVSILGTRELNPGQVFHDRWILSARGEHATAEVYLAFGQDFTRNTIQVLGTDGSLQADLHHHHYEGERKTQWLDFWNTFLAGWRRGRMLRRSAARGAFYWFRQTLGLGGREDAFYAGMRDSIRSFHASIRAGETPRIDGEHGVKVTEWCEAAVAGLAEPTPAPPLDIAPGPVRPGEVCVLGGTGFIGRRTLDALLERDVPVTAVARRRHTLPPVLTDGVRAGAIRLFQASLGDEAGLREAIRGCQTVLHLATGNGDTWDEVERVMVKGTERLAELCLEEGVERLVYVSSTASLYLGHDCGTDVLADDPAGDPKPAARAIYARGKAEAERALLRLHEQRGLPVVVARPAIVVGKGTPLQHSGLGLWVRDNHCVGWGRGARPVPLVHVDDVADGLARMCVHEGDDLHGRALNLAARAGLGAHEVVTRMREATGRDFVFHPRSLLLSQLIETAKWIVKKVGGRKDAAFPSYRDLKSRAMHPELSCDLARERLGWRPCDDGEELMRRILAPDAEGGP